MLTIIQLSLLIHAPHSLALIFLVLLISILNWVYYTLLSTRSYFESSLNLCSTKLFVCLFVYSFG